MNERMNEYTYNIRALIAFVEYPSNSIVATNTNLVMNISYYVTNIYQYIDKNKIIIIKSKGQIN